MIGRSVGASRFLIIIAVVSLFAASVTMLVYGAIETFEVIFSTVGNAVTSKGAKELLLAFIEIADVFLIATVLYIIAAGLYELFIDDNLPLLPAWLVIHDLDDLKNKLIGVVIVVLGVLFLGQVVTWDGARDLLGYGVAVALVIVALTYFLSQQPKKQKPPDDVT